MNREKIKRLMGLTALIVIGLMLFRSATIVSAVHDLGLFELDRNAITNHAGTGLPDDWDRLYTNAGHAQAFTGIIEDTMGTNPLGTTGTQFQAGGSKDDLDLSPGGATGQVWKWDPGEPLDKDDITNAYAAAYTNMVDTGNNNVGDLIVYFGLDRFANNGSAQVGFWFLQDPTFGLTTTPSGGGYLFSGHHVVGDVLVQSNFTQGGVIDTISVYEWVGSGGSNGTLNLLFTAQDCSTTGADDPACATVNQGDTSSPWPFTPKFGTPGIFPQGSFFEGGINITRLVPDAGCFTGFLAETRSSTPFDSRLKDFALGQFNLCSIKVTKTGDTLSKVGDAVNYSITIQNTGAIPVYKDDITDTLLGDITLNGVNQANSYIVSNTCGASLSPGASCTITATRTVQAGDPDPLPNTVTAVYRGKSDLSGIAVSDSDDHSVNLFQPSISFKKSGDELSKVGDSVDYTLTLKNTSSSDSPNLTCTVSDPLVGVNKTVHLAPGGSDVTNASRVVQAGDSDPLVNTASASCSVDGFSNVLNASASHSVNLFQPSVKVVKSGDTLSKVGDPVDYTITVTNTSSSDSPNLENGSIVDDVLGDLLDPANPYVTSSTCAAVLPTGGSCVIHATRIVQAGDPDPLVNTVTVHYNPVGFPNDIHASDSHSVNLFQPSVKIDKSGDTLSKVGDSVDYTITVDNTSSSDSPNLTCTVSDPLLGLSKNISLAPGGSDVTNASRVVQAGDPDPLVNTAAVDCTVDGFGNKLHAEATHSVNLFQPSISVEKMANTPISKVGDDVVYTIKVCNTSSSDSPNLVKDSVSDSLISGVDAAFGASLAPGACESHDFTRTVQAGDPDPLVNTVTVHYNPDGFPNDITAQTQASVDLVHPGLAVLKDCSPAIASPGATITYTCTISNTGDVQLNVVSIVDSLVGDLTNPANFSSSTCGASLAAGESCAITYTFTAPSGTSSLVNTVTASYQVNGLSNVLTASSSCTVSIPTEGCTPGFWKNHTSLWDEPTDPIAAAAGFTTTTSFNSFFGLTSAQSGFADSLTMLDAVNLGGGDGAKLARHGVSSLLNIAAGLNYPLPPGINNATDLYNAIRNAYLTSTFEPLATELADANNLNCPF
jgi:uncharacterized repeat protein (TIGR01451 family)